MPRVDPPPSPWTPIEAPIPLLKSELTLRLGEFVRAVSTGTVYALLGDRGDAVEKVHHALAAIGLDAPSAGDMAWLLIRRSLLAALLELGAELLPQKAEIVGEKRLTELADQALDGVTMELDPDFVARPGELAVVDAGARLLGALLREAGAVDLPTEAALARRFRTHFIYAFGREWNRAPADYAAINQAVGSCVTPAVVEEYAWQLLGWKLRQQLETPILGESFALPDIYVRLRAWFEQATDQPRAGRRREDREPGGPPRRVVVDLHQAVGDWLGQAAVDDSLRVISGGPGSGKSSFAKTLAAELAGDGRRVVLVPLQWFNVGGDIARALQTYLEQTQHLPFSPLDAEHRPPELLLIFDGLDELSEAGRASAEAAKRFVAHLVAALANLNQARQRVRALITGRVVAVQELEEFWRREGTVLHVLPLFVPETERRGYHDCAGLLHADQRDELWSRFAAARGRAERALPDELRDERFADLTADPLSCLLLALTRERGNVDFAALEHLNEVYADMLAAAYDRKWGGGAHPGARPLEQAEFEALLEAIALAVWHGTGRTATYGAIAEQCTVERLQALFGDGPDESWRTGLRGVIAAYYFRGRGDGAVRENAFEFIHKSFGEYLAARRIVEAMDTVDAGLRQTDPRFRWGEDAALEEWARVCGPTPLSLEILGFLRGEVALRGAETAAAWQSSLVKLVNHVLRHGLPMESLGLGSYHEMKRQARNAEETLLAALNACARVTRLVSNIAWPTSTGAGEWIGALRGQRDWNGPSSHCIVLGCLGWTNLAGRCLVNQDLALANLTRAKLTRADLTRAFLGGADLFNANLTFADLTGANLTGANLTGANLTNAILTDAILTDAGLTGAYLTRACLAGADLIHANLTGANLTDAILTRAKVSRAQLSQAFGPWRGTPDWLDDD